MRFANDFHSWLRHSWKLLANRLTRDPKIVIHGNSCIILYIHILIYKHGADFSNTSFGVTKYEISHWPLQSSSRRFCSVLIHCTKHTVRKLKIVAITFYGEAKKCYQQERANWVKSLSNSLASGAMLYWVNYFSVYLRWNKSWQL